MSGEVSLIVLPASGANARTFQVAREQLAALMGGDFRWITRPGDVVFDGDTRECLYSHPAAGTQKNAKSSPATEGDEPASAEPQDAEPSAASDPSTPSTQRLDPGAQAARTAGTFDDFAQILQVMSEREAAMAARFDAISDHILSQKLLLSDAMTRTRLAEERTAQTRAVEEYKAIAAPPKQSGWKSSTGDSAHKLAQIAYVCGAQAVRATIKDGFK